MTQNRYRIIFLSMVLVAFLYRIWGLGFGLPHQFHQDEPVVVNHALAYGTGDMNPHFFAIPPLTSYILFFFYGILFTAGKIFGAWANTGEFAVQFFKDPTIFYLVGRFFMGVIPGVLCVILTYRLAEKFISKEGALYAAAIMTVSFLNVINSHYIYTDMLLVMFIILTMIGLLSIYKNPGIKEYCVTGALIGISAGVKYNGILLLAPYLLMHILVAVHYGRERDKALFSRKVGMGLVCAALAFTAVNPFMVIDHRGFINSVLRQAGAFWYTGWKHHITYSLFEGMSLPLAAAGIFGLFLLCLRKDAFTRAFVFFPGVFYLVIVFRSQHFSRYVLPLVPFLAIGASYLIFERLYGYLKNPILRKLAVLVSICLLIPTGLKSLKADMLFTSEDTRVEAANWIRGDLPEGTKIACDSTTFRPALKQPYSQLREKKEFLNDQPGLKDLKSRKLQLMMQASDNDREGYPLYFLFDDPASQGQFLATVPALPYDIPALKENGIEYVTINGQLRSREKDKFLSKLASEGVMIKEFSPYKDDVFRRAIDRTATTCIPVMGRDVFSREKMGPSIRIYRIK